MQSIFVILTAIVIAVMAKKRGRSLWACGLIGAAVFLVIDTIVSLILVAILWDSLGSTGSIYILATVKLVLCATVVYGFYANLRPIVIPTPGQTSGKGEIPGAVRSQKIVGQDPEKSSLPGHPEWVACSNCGKPIDLGWLHCGYCGQKIIKTEGNADQGVFLPPPPKPKPESSNKRKGSTKSRLPIIIAGICGLLIMALLVVTAILKSAYQREKARTAPSAPAPQTTPITEIYPTPIPPSLSQVIPIGASQISPKDDMLLVSVPEGEFEMGTTDAESTAAVQQCITEISSAEVVIDSAEIIQNRCEDTITAEKPNHTVWLDGFWIDRTEVTNAMYAGCVSERACEASAYGDNGDLNGANQPVIGVDWANAAAYCVWAGRRLPTEAEWEKAARGTNGRTYPWGNIPPNQQLTNFLEISGTTSAVGSYLAGASPYGALDMAGNVQEWVADWYGETYYASSPQRNPAGPDTGENRVLRGGHWGYTAILGVRAASRDFNMPDAKNYGVGFRCALSSPGAESPLPVAEPLAAGEWAADTDFGKLVFVVDASGTKITKMSYQFSNWECGTLPSSVQPIRTSTVEGKWLITDGYFSVFNYIDSYTKQSMTFNGTYDPANQRYSGTWEEVSYGTRCAGTWEAVATK